MNRRDIELLSAYLDGELKTSDSAKLETRLKSDPELVSVLNDLRATRTLLRKLPQRKAPRNFTLTRKMAGQNPPLPRTYPAFRFVTAVATLLFFFSFGLNFVGTQLAQAPAFGRGGGGGGVEEFQSFAESEPALEAPSAEEAPAEPALEAPAAPAPAESTLAVELAPTMVPAPQETAISPAEDATRIMETPVAKEVEGESAIAQDQVSGMNEAMETSEAPKLSPLIPSAWQVGLAVVALASALFMGLMRQFSVRRWK